jgi:hypothetical protein
MLSETPKTRSQLLSALARASFRAFQIADVSNREDAAKVSKQLTQYVLGRKTACVVILWGR